jgi:mRNA interferase YafQ
MRSPSYTGQFRKDVKLADQLSEKRGKDLGKLRQVIALLVAGTALPRALRDHPLKGEWKPARDLHLEPDWLLIYTADAETVRFERTGTHADLFGL